MDDHVTLTFDYGNATFTDDLTPAEARYLVNHINNKLEQLEDKK